jgi:hypothetical protein
MVGGLLCFEALVSPLVWWLAFVAGTFAAVEGAAPGWLVAMDRLGAWGPLVLCVPLTGAAVVLFAHPQRYTPVAAAACFAAALPNLLGAVGLIIYNGGRSEGPLGPRLVGIALAAAFGYIAMTLIEEGARLVRGADLGRSG